MRIVVTGGSGKVGTAVLAELLRHGHDVVPVDVRGRDDSQAPATKIADLTQFEQVKAALKGADAVCHLGNWPDIGEERAAAGFANNVNSTFNIFHAAGELGITQVVNASSLQVYGVVRNYPEEVLAAPEYFPLDEEHPLLACNPYGLSKALGESVAQAAARRRPELCAFSLRFTYIMPDDAPADAEDAFQSAPLVSALATFVRQSDAARAVRLCCESDRVGHTALNIVAPWVSRPWNNAELLASYGKVPPFRRPLRQDEPLVCFRKAEELIGFTANCPLHKPEDVQFQKQ